ncbi:carbohydrate ABC transporter permease [Paenibacillus sp. CF384]|uniref:carbohydrate ABC transporter permease n=1 Tax=Paenibacillus sp. CF384 TaxID=1884382 RepID=UPI00089C77EA|nr:carbohydrate ABC transporter permease [Paenibacillus sp. CF384]SDX89779.1 putative aldouronate transport system permease protein [Paenibacillus sp. CF384]
MVNYRSPSRTAFIVFNTIVLSLTAIACIIPFIHLLAISFSGSSAVAAGKVVFWPVDLTTVSYEFAFRGGKFLPALWVSISRVLLGVIVNLVLIVITAYPLSKNKDKVFGRNIYMIYFVLTIIINGGLIPTYILVTKLGLLNSLWSLILPGALPIFSMIIMMNFMRGLPEEIEQAAMIDGAGVFATLFRVMLPLLTPALATVGLFSVVAHWNDWFSGLIYMQDSRNYPLQTYLHTLIINFEEVIRMAQGDTAKILAYMNVRTGRAAQLFLATIPVLVVYPFIQKYFTTGLVLGSVKG